MKTKTMASQILAMMVVGAFIFSSVVYADATIVDNLNMNGTANTSFGLYNDGNLLVGQEEQINGSLNRTRVLTINTSDDELRQYVETNSQGWSSSSVSEYAVEGMIGQAVSYLKGEDYSLQNAPEIGRELDSYFASDQDIQVLLNYIQDLQAKDANLNFRVTAIERTLEEIASEDLCNAKLETAEKYNITLKGMKCGLNSTYYYTVDPATHNGSKLMSIETYNPDVDPRPIKMTMAVPTSVKTGENFTMAILLNNTGSKFGFYKISVKLPDAWESNETLFSGTIADNEVKSIYLTVVPGEGGGNITAYAKIVMSGKTYNLMANANMEADSSKPDNASSSTEGMPLVVITSNMIYGIWDGIGNGVEIIGNTVMTTTTILGNNSEDALNNLSERMNGSGTPIISPIFYPATTSTILHNIEELGASGAQNIISNVSFDMKNLSVGEGA